MANKFFEGFIIGGVVGFIFGVLSAPKPGEELRRELADGSEEFYNKASSSVSQIKEATGHTISDIQHKGEDVIKKASDSVYTAKEQISNKIHQLAGQSTAVLADDN